MGDVSLDSLTAAQLRERVEQLEQALSSRIIIEQAKGVLAERLKLDVDDAFVILRSAARSNRLKLHDLAARVVREPKTPMPVIGAIAREQRLRSAWMMELVEAQKRTLDEMRWALEATRNELQRDRSQRSGDRVLRKGH
jgi:ANTAR domain-containing protein